MKILLNNVYHTLLALALLTVGVILICSDTYYQWPPELMWLENDNVVGLVGILAAIGLLTYIFSLNKPVRLNAICLTASVFFWTSIAGFELMHDIALHDIHGLIAFTLEVVMLLLSFVLIFKTQTKKER